LQQPASDHSADPGILETLKQYDTCTIANAIERFQVRLRNEGYTRPGLKCLSGSFPTIIGYAATGRVRTANPPMSGGHYYEGTDWWERVDRLPAPRIAVIEDIDDHPGAGSVAGEVHCAILKSLNFVGLATNGAVRDLPGLRRLDFPVFAAFVTIGHSYVHLIDSGLPVNICGLTVESGDLLCGDCHGLLSVPKDIAAQLPPVVVEIAQHERKVIDLCQSPEFSVEKLRELVRASE
jgi:4-hydroxy-4-methyl-2-oxoglutarate aldolase